MQTVDESQNEKNLDMLSQRIRNARKNARLSQADLARTIGVSDKSVSAYEKGRSIPPFEKLKRIAHSTNLPITYFTNEQTDEEDILQKLDIIEKQLQEIKTLLKKD